VSQKSDLNEKKLQMLEVASQSHLQTSEDHVQALIKASMDPFLSKEELASESRLKWKVSTFSQNSV